MKKYIVEVSTHENYYTDDWNFEEFVIAENAEEAVNFAKNYLIENGEDVEEILFRITKIA